MEQPLVDFAAIAATVGNEPRHNHSGVSDEIRGRKEYLGKVADKLGKLGYEVTFDVPSGHVVETIANVAQEGFEIVLMATHGRTGFSKFVLGSVSEGVLHKARCPVLIV
jgi:nucleotide-binding universal stress UspA family protein